MKKLLKLIGFLSIIYAVVSCNDFLESESNSTFTESTVFSNLDFATKAVNGIYVSLTSQNMYDYRLGLFFKTDTDIELLTTANNGSVASLAHYAGNDGIAELNSVWTIIYQTIERANICIDNLPQSPIWENEHAKDARRLYGEAVTLRAQLYYELVNLWGDVPFSVKATQSGDDYYLPKTDRDSIYEYLIQDLKDVEDFVPWMSETRTTERISKGYVKGLRARMALAYAGYSLRNKTFETRRGRNWQEYYQIANQECREIMESGKHELNPSFEGIFKNLHAYSMDLTHREVLFEVAFGRLYSGRVAQSIGMPHSAYPPDPKYGRAASEIKLAPNYFYTFDKKDKRRNVSVELYNYSNKSYLGQQRLVATTDYSPTKWRRSWITPSMGGDLASVQFTGVNWPLMRYSDVVLMFAESENEINGPTAAAKEALSMVRRRAFSPEMWPEKVDGYINSISSSKESFFNAIVDERAWEFGGEMLRKYDLVRWNLLGTKLAKMKEECFGIMNNEPKYSEIPDYIYWKYKDDNETLDILNPDYRISGSVQGYNKQYWLTAQSDGSKSYFTKVLSERVANGFDATKNNHLFPISSQIIAASNGVLENDQIP